MKRLICAALVCCMLMNGACALAEGPDWPALFQEAKEAIEQWLGLPPDGKEAQGVNKQAVLERLQAIGIEITPETLSRYEKGWQAMQKRETRQTETDLFFAQNILIIQGMGDYDYDTDVWTPTSSQVYSFDAEVYNVGSMYRLFLQGVASIAPGFDYTDAEESIEEAERQIFPTDSAEDMEVYLEEWKALGHMPDEGVTTVSFRLNGHDYRKELGFRGDWFNEDAISWINEVLEQEGFDGRLYAFFDGGQGLILIYGSPERAGALGQILENTPYGL